MIPQGHGLGEELDGVGQHAAGGGRSPAPGAIQELAAFHGSHEEIAQVHERVRVGWVGLHTSREVGEGLVQPRIREFHHKVPCLRHIYTRKRCL
jgi:hypothetical protein